MLNVPLDPNHVAWTRRLLDMIKVGGVWGIPNASLIVHKTGEDRIMFTLPNEEQDTLDSMKIVSAHAIAAGYTVEEE